jgi:hypothetical protein
LTVHHAYLLVSLNARRSNNFEYCIFCFNNVYSPFCKIPFVSQGNRRLMEDDKAGEDLGVGGYSKKNCKHCNGPTPSKKDGPVIVNVNCGGKGSHSGSHSGSWSSDEV